MTQTKSLNLPLLIICKNLVYHSLKLRYKFWYFLGLKTGDSIPVQINLQIERIYAKFKFIQPRVFFLICVIAFFCLLLRFLRVQFTRQIIKLAVITLKRFRTSNFSACVDNRWQDFWSTCYPLQRNVFRFLRAENHRFSLKELWCSRKARLCPEELLILLLVNRM